MAHRRGVASEQMAIAAKDKYELQAEEAARRIIRGQIGVARYLSPAPAASLRVASSAGQPLSRQLRAELEEAFGAELSAVRVHSDTAASAAARERHALAFASGRDLYFDDGWFRPHEPRGRRLLLHEIAHALQQTGRRNSRGQIAATDLAGAGVIQLQRTSPLDSRYDQSPTFEWIRDQHLKCDQSGTDTLKSFAQKITDQMQIASNANDPDVMERFWVKWEADITTNFRTAPDSNRHLRSFFYDFLKFGKRWEAAGLMLFRDMRLKSAFYSADAYANMPIPEDFSWLLDFWTGHPLLKDYGPGRFVDTFGIYLFAPWFDIQNLGNQKPFEPYAADLFDQIEKQSDLFPNELFYATLWAVRRADEIRQKPGEGKMQELAQKVAPGIPVSRLSPRQRKALAGEIVNWADEVLTLQGAIAKEKPEVQKLLTFQVPLGDQKASVIELVKKVAQDAVDYWGLIEKFERFRGAGVTSAELGGRAREILTAFATRQEAIRFWDTLKKNAELFFALELDEPGKPERNTLPSDQEYLLRRQRMVDALRKASLDNLENKLLGELRKTPDQKSIDLRVAYGWTTYRTYDLIAVLEAYEGSDDLDARVAHRLRVAAALSAFAGAASRGEVADLANEVTSATLEGQTQSQLALITPPGATTPWALDESAPIAQLTRDFDPTKVLPRLEPLTTGMLRDFFEAAYRTNFKLQIENLLNDESVKAYDPAKKPLLARAATAARTFPRPMRYIVARENVEHAARPDAEIADLILHHPKTDDFLKSLNYPEAVLPQSLDAGVFLWTLPPLKELIEKLQKVDFFNALILKSLQPDQDPDAVAIGLTALLPWDTWWQLLDEALKAAGSSAALDAARDTFATSLAQANALALSALTDKMREASIYERRNRVRRRLIPLLAQYDRFHELDRTADGTLIWDIPQIVLKEIDTLVAATGPQNEQPLHQAAVALQLAETIRDKLNVSPRFDVITGYSPLIQFTLKQVDNNVAGLQTVLASGEDLKWVSDRADVLRGVQKDFQAGQATGAQRFGMDGMVGNGEEFLVGTGQGYQINKGETFVIDGVTYKLVHVLKNFTYHPKFGIHESELLVDGQPITDAKDRAVIDLVQFQFGTAPNAPIETVKGDNDLLLSQISYAVSLEAILRQLQDLNAFIQGTMELTLDVLELIPGEGQALMAARLAINILQFIASGEYQDLIDQLYKNPWDTVKLLVGVIFDFFQPAALWEYLLFGNFSRLNELHKDRQPPKGAKEPKTKTEKIIAVVKRIYNLGKEFLGGAARVQTKVRWKAETFELFVLGHPLLAKAIHFVADRLERIELLTLQMLAIGRAIDEASAEWDQATSDLPGTILEMVDQLLEFKLPQEIIDKGRVLEIIVDLIIKRLGAKYRIAATVILKLLEIAGKKDEVFKAIADVIPPEFDPNQLWQDEVLAKIEPPINEARDELMDTILDKLLEFDVFKDKAALFQEAKTRRKERQAKVQPEDFPETALYSSRQPEVGAQVCVPASAGRPLDAPVRKAAERRFGHDFGHVRLHTGADATAATRSAGAEALASGSHVFLGPELSPRSVRGSRVLHHELTHVLQQTGPRPLGGQHNDAPHPGSPGKGVVFDPRREAAAQSIAASPRPDHAGVPSAPMPAAQIEGVQPLFPFNIIRRLLTKASGTADIEADAATAESGVGGKHIPESVKKRLDGFLADFAAAIDDDKRFKTPVAPFEFTGRLNGNSYDIPAAIRRHLKGDQAGHNAALEKALAVEVLDSVQEEKATEEPGQPAPEPVRVLNIKRFGDALSRTILGETGILMKIKLAETSEESQVTVESMQVLYVYLPEIHGAHELWKAALEGWIEDGLIKDSDRGIWLPRVRGYLAGQGIVSGIWKPKTYSLLKSVFDAVQAYSKPGDAVTPAELPSKANYLKPEGQTGIGLRLGIYKGQRGKERESHHITQYLLMEYFANVHHSKLAFPLVKDDPTIYPGLSAAMVFRRQGQKEMDLAGLEAGRGAKMPAILLARPTHREGDLHVRKADDFPGLTDDAPADVVDFVFGEAIKANEPKVQGAAGASKSYLDSEAAGATEFEKYKARQGKDAVEKTIYTAMQATYQWMKGYMQPRLQLALPEIERRYFNDLSTREKISKGEMAVVYAAAVARNEKEMSSWGWKG
jgi:hypothetical protein